MSGGSPISLCVLELLALEVQVGFGVAVGDFRGLAKMPAYLFALAKTREQDGATILGGVQGYLLEGKDLAPSLEDVAPGKAAYRMRTTVWGPPEHTCHRL